MMLKISNWMRLLREHLHIAPIEAKVIATEAKVIAIEDALKNVDVTIATGQALLTNEQKHLEAILTEIENTTCQLNLAIEVERRYREETKVQLVSEIAVMTNEIKRVADIVEQHIRPTHHDDPK